MFNQDQSTEMLLSHKEFTANLNSRTKELELAAKTLNALSELKNINNQDWFDRLIEKEVHGELSEIAYALRVHLKESTVHCKDKCWHETRREVFEVSKSLDRLSERIMEAVEPIRLENKDLSMKVKSEISATEMRIVKAKISFIASGISILSRSLARAENLAASINISQA